MSDLAEVFGVFFMTQFFKSLPKELEEAASIDGASTFRTFRQITCRTPTSPWPALAILRFQGEWNAFGPWVSHPKRGEECGEGPVLADFRSSPIPTTTTARGKVRYVGISSLTLFNSIR